MDEFNRIIIYEDKNKIIKKIIKRLRMCLFNKVDLKYWDIIGLVYSFNKNTGI